jgi:putative oxidoreductase
MNWAGNQKGEGIEYFIILLGVALTLVIAGGGKASVDAALAPETAKS